MRLVMMPSYRCRMPAVSAAPRVAPAHQLQPWASRQEPYLGKQQHHTSTPAVHGSNRDAPLTKQSPSRRIQSAGLRGAVCAILSVTVGMPNIRTPPDFFGIGTALTGGEK